VAAPWVDELGRGATGLGLLLAANPLGVTVGGLVIARLVRPDRREGLVVPLVVLSLAPVLLAGVVGLLWIGRIGTVTPGIGLEPLLIAFIATVIGGMRSLAGAVIGGFVLALIDTGLNYTLPQDLLKFRDAFTFSLVILILLWRPEGLMRGPASGQRT
jgi:branched-chain amino acid transport system permease protein